MKEKLLIVGIGALAREVVDFVNRYDLYDIIGYAVDEAYLIPEYEGEKVYPLERLEDCVNKEEIKVFVAIHWYNYMNKYKRQKFEDLKSRGFHFANLVSPLASIRCQSIGEGNWIEDFVYIGYQTTIGDNNTFRPGTLIGHYDTIADHNVFSGRAYIMGEVRVGNQNYFGSESLVFNKLAIGDQCLIGAGSVVKKKLSNYMMTSAVECVYKQSKATVVERILSPQYNDFINDYNSYSEQ